MSKAITIAEEEAAGAPYSPTIADLSQAPVRRWLTPQSLVVALGVLLVQVYIAQPAFTQLTRVCAGLMAGTLALLITRYVVVRPPRLPWLEFLYAIHYTQFALATTVEPTPVGVYGVIPSPASLETAALIALSAGYTFIAAFALTSAAFKGRARRNVLLPRLDPEIVAAGSRYYVLVAAGYVLLTSYAPAFHTSILSVANLTDRLFGHGSLIAVAGVAYLTRPNPSTRLSLIIAIVAIGAGVAATSMLNNAVFPLVGLAILWWRARERIPVIPVVVAVGVLLVLQPIKQNFRTIMWVEQSNMSVVDAWSKAFTDSASGTDDGIVGRASAGSEATRSRAGALTALAYVVDVVPGAVPYAGGQVYEVLVYAAIPRVLWPGKPNMTKVGLDPSTIALGLTDREGAEHSTIGLTLSSQGYFEHGLAGSLGWMGLLGVVAALLAAYFGSSLGGTLAAAALLTPWSLAIEGGFLNCFSGLWQNVFGVTLVSWLVWWLGTTLLKQQGRAHEGPSRTIA